MYEIKISRRDQLTLAMKLVLSSFFLLPFTVYILISSLVLQLLVSQNSRRRRTRRTSVFQPKTILVTGVSTTNGLALARMFYQAGHTVIGADHQIYGIPVHGRFSRAVKKFYALPSPNLGSAHIHYTRDLLNIISKEQASLWINCTELVSKVKDSEINEAIERVSKCRGVQLDSKITSLLCNANAFLQYIKSLDLPTPQIQHVTSRNAVHNFLGRADQSEKFYITEKTKARSLLAGQGGSDLLPRRSISQTYQHVSQLPISDKQPFVLQQHLEGEKYQTQALIVRGVVEAFVACQDSKTVSYLEPLPESSALYQSMLKYTQEIVSRSHSVWTGHLSLLFLIHDRPSEKGLERLLLAIQCVPSMGNIGILLGEAREAVVERYLKASGPIQVNGFTASPTKVVGSSGRYKYYWMGHDLVNLVIDPFMLMLRREMSILQYLSSCCTFIQHLLFWKEATYELWDPLPWWWQYHVYWPSRILMALVHGDQWNTIDVSTMKMNWI